MVGHDRPDRVDPVAHPRIHSDVAELASLARVAIEQQCAADPGDEAAVDRIITTVFGRIDTGRAFAFVDDPGELRRIVGLVREIVADGAVATA